MQPRTTFVNGINPFGEYKPKTKERRPFVHVANSAPAKKVLQYVRDNPGIPAKEVKAKLSVRGTYGYLTALEKDGLIRFVRIRDDSGKGPRLKHCYPIKTQQEKTHGH